MVTRRSNLGGCARATSHYLSEDCTAKYSPGETS